MKMARNSWGEPYECQKPWPEEDCFVQCGGSGVVFPGGSVVDMLTDPDEGLKKVRDAKVHRGTPDAYTTAFFEAFPKEPLSTFIRGEGATIAEAEAAAWAKYERLLACPSPHDSEDCFEKRGYTNGLGFCKDCGASHSKAFAPWEPCVDCGTKTYYGRDRDGNNVCEACVKKMPIERWCDATVSMLADIGELMERGYTREDIQAEDERRRAARRKAREAKA